MGLFDFIKKTVLGDEKEDSGGPRINAKCPKCGAEVDLSSKRCPKCGTHTELLFRIKCPKCGTVNELKNRECKKCGQTLRNSEQEEPVHRPKYICPICGYRADFYMLKCPACGTRFA